MDIESTKYGSLEEIYEAAVNYGESIALMNLSDAPVVGERFEAIDNEELFIETADEAKDEFIRTVVANESEHTRQFSPAEFWIAALNNRDDSEEAWEKLEEGIVKGVTNVAENNYETWEEQENFYIENEQSIGFPH